MPLLFHCQCGQQLRAPEEFAGRRIKCPHCHQVLAVPAPKVHGNGEESDAPPAVPRPAAGAPEMVRFSCDCGTFMQAKREYGGRRTRCPGCGAVLRIPDHESAGR
jgi:hypothetical protein